MSVKTLRPDQQDVIDKTYRALEHRKKRILTVMPTGSGKTYVAGHQIKDAVEAGHHSLFLVNRDALVLQSYEEFTSLGLEVGVWAGEHTSLQNTKAPVQVASVQTLLARGDIPQFNPTIVYADEAHLTSYSQATEKYFLNPNIPIIGLTATPYRLARNQELGDKYSHLVTGLLPYQMINMGLLKKPVYFNLSKKYKIRHEASIPFLIQKWKELAQGRKTICFASGVEEAHAIAKGFSEAGIPFAAVDGKMSSKKRNKIYQDLESGVLIGVASCDALSEGFNIPSISCVILARDTESEGKFIQQVGRGIRKFLNLLDCIILDAVGLTHKFGGIEEKMEYSLIRSTEKEKGSIPKKTCPHCEAIMFAFCTECDRCKYKFPSKDMPLLSPEERMLQMVVPKEKRLEVLAYRTARRKAYKKGHSLDSVESKFKLSADYTRGAIFQYRSDVESQSQFLQYLQQRARKENHDQSWIQAEFFKEFGFA